MEMPTAKAAAATSKTVTPCFLIITSSSTLSFTGSMKPYPVFGYMASLSTHFQSLVSVQFTPIFSQS